MVRPSTPDTPVLWMGKESLPSLCRDDHLADIIGRLEDDCSMKDDTCDLGELRARSYPFPFSRSQNRDRY